MELTQMNGDFLLKKGRLLLQLEVPMDDPRVAAVAARHKVSTAVIMLRYVSQHGITIVTASDKLEYDEEDM